MVEAAVVPETQMALRTPTTPAPERMLKRSPREARAHKMVMILWQRRMVLPEAVQWTAKRPPTNEVTQGLAESYRRPAGCRLRPCSSLGRSCY
jgi:hypothetical protein